MNDRLLESAQEMSLPARMGGDVGNAEADSQEASGDRSAESATSADNTFLNSPAADLPAHVLADIRLEQAEADFFSCPSCGGTLDLIGYEQVCQDCDFSEEIEVTDYRDEYSAIEERT